MAELREQSYELVGVDQLVPHPDNPRSGDIEAIEESVAQNGFYGALVAQRTTGYVLAGNHRLLAAQRAGLTHLPVVWVDLDDDRARRILLVDNRSNDRAGYDNQRLVDLLGELNVTSDGLVGTGYTAQDLAALAATHLDEPEQTDEQEPDPPGDDTPVISQPGDVWILGQHRLLVGDAGDAEAVTAMLDGDVCDLLWTDPPYGVDYVGKTADALTLANDGASWADVLDKAITVALDACRPGGPTYIAHADTARVVLHQVLDKHDLAYRQTLVWVKDIMVLGHSDYHWRHEPLWYGFLPGGTGRRGRGGEHWYGDNAQTTVLEFAKPSRSAEHPTMKPVELIARCLGNSAPPAGLVYDPFAGSGSTLLAAHQLGHRARLVELDPRYADVICRRWQTITGIEPVRASTGEHVDFC